MKRFSIFTCSYKEVCLMYVRNFQNINKIKLQRWQSCFKEEKIPFVPQAFCVPFVTELLRTK